MIPPQIQTNLMYPPGSQILPHQNYHAMNQMGYNPHYFPPYQIPHIPGYPPNIVNMNYFTPPPNNGINTYNNISPNSTSTTVQANFDNKTNNNESKGEHLEFLT